MTDTIEYSFNTHKDLNKNICIENYNELIVKRLNCVFHIMMNYYM